MYRPRRSFLSPWAGDGVDIVCGCGAGGWGAAHTKSAREYYARSVAIFEQTGNEVELARTYKVYARFLKAEPEWADDDAVREEAEQMHTRAEEIFGRLRISLADRSGPNPAVPR
mgnify:CR=1 FL=1